MEFVTPLAKKGRVADEDVGSEPFPCTNMFLLFCLFDSGLIDRKFSLF